MLFDELQNIPIADGALEAPTAVNKGSKAGAAQDSADDGPAYDGECWAFSSRYVKTTQAALQAALDAIQVAPAMTPPSITTHL